MGMFDKDKQYGLRLDREFKTGEHFVLWGVNLPGEVIATSFGDAEVAKLKVSRMDNTGFKYVVQTVAGAIVEKCKEADRTDFPAVVTLQRIPSERSDTGHALVLQFVAPYGAQPSATATEPPPAAPAPAEDDFPF